MSGTSTSTCRETSATQAATVKIRASGVRRLFDAGRRSVAALGPLDLEITDGEFVCLVGPSGCGKSTFLRIVGGLLNPSEGEVSLLARDPRRATAMVFQEYSIFPWKTVESNIRFPHNFVTVYDIRSGAKLHRWPAPLRGYVSYLALDISGLNASLVGLEDVLVFNAWNISVPPSRWPAKR